MTKHLRFLFVMLLAMIWSAGWAQTTVEQTVFTATSSDNIGGDKNVSFSCDKGGGTADPNTKSNMIQLYQIDSKSKIGYGNTITISIEKGYEINSVTIGTNKESSVAYTLDSETTLSATTKVNANKEFSVTELSANSITFYCMGTAKANRFMVNKLSVTYSATGSSNKTSTSLKFPQDAFTYSTIDNYSSFTGQVATLTSEGTALTGKTITYSKSGDDIFSSFDTTNGTLALNGNPGKATVIATFAGDDTYASSSASYTISVKEVVKDIATLKPRLTSSYNNFTLKLTDAIVTYKSGDVLYIQDNTAGIYCSGSTTLNNNDKVNGLVEIKARIYNGQSTITQWTLAEDATIDHNVEFTPEVVTLAQLNDNIDKYENMRVKVIGATANAAMSNNQTKLNQDGASLVLYSKVKSINWDFVADDVLDIEGYPITNVYNNVSTKELLVYKKSDVAINSSVVTTTLSFDSTEKAFNVFKGSESSFTAPKAVVKDALGNVVEGANITYVSDAPTIASVDENGNVTFGSAFGQATITASYTGDETHKPATSISYTITYSKIPTEMAWSKSSVSVNIGDNLSAPTLTLTANGENILAGKTIQYKSSNEEVAMIDETGNIVLMDKDGSTDITATFAGDDTYQEASATYTLKVIDPNKTDVTFDFTKPEDYGYAKPEPKKNTEFSEGAKLESHGVVITNVKKGNSTTTRFAIKNNVITFCVYTGAILTVEAPAGFAINKIDFTDDGSNTVNNFNFSTGKLSSKTWTGLAETLTMEVVSNQVFLEKMTVNLVKVENITLDESADNTIEAKTGVNVTLKRSMVANEWNTICLPFNVSKEKAQTAFGEGVKIAELNAGSTGTTLSFNSVNEISATKPYLIKPSKENTSNEYVFENVNVVADDINKKYEITEGYLAFKGIYNMMDITKDVVDNVDATYYAAFLGAGNKIYKAGTGKTKGFRAYFAIPNSASASALRVVIDGTATSIKNIDSEVVESNAPVYNLQGQRVDGNNLTPGIYVKAGKKFVVK